MVCVSLPGYIVARQGMFDAEAQKFVANLNVSLFTPCLIFTKLASQLTAEKLVDLAIIPFIFLVQTFISYLASIAMARLFRFKKRQTNFVIAMGVFGNSNSLPISLVISLAGTLKGLHWDKVPGDNDNEVAARGILYLLIFQQLGQLLRWSWGYNVLLAPAEKYIEEGSSEDANLEHGRAGRYTDEPDENEDQQLIEAIYDGEDGRPASQEGSGSNDTAFESGGQTPVTYRHHASAKSSRSSSRTNPLKLDPQQEIVAPANGNVMPRHQTSGSHMTSFPTMDSTREDGSVSGITSFFRQTKQKLSSRTTKIEALVSEHASKLFAALPAPARKVLSKIWAGLCRFVLGVWAFMNPPLWAMLAAIIVASIPSLQRLFFEEGTFVRNSVTRAVAQSGGVAVPLILVVLGANLAKNTLPKDPDGSIEDPKEERNLLIAALVSRMLLPTILMAPLLALTAKYIPVSIVDDKIFVIVCFLLTGAPTALQLAQICQVNNVYMGVMSKILFQSYVVWYVLFPKEDSGFFPPRHY